MNNHNFKSSHSSVGSIAQKKINLNLLILDVNSSSVSMEMSHSSQTLKGCFKKYKQSNQKSILT